METLKMIVTILMGITLAGVVAFEILMIVDMVAEKLGYEELSEKINGFLFDLNEKIERIWS